MTARLGLTAVILSALLSLPGCETDVPQTARVTGVIDGDTIVIEGGHHIRYIGIDTPEREEPFYEEAREYNQELVENRTVRLEKDVTDRDRFDRLLRYAYVGDVFVNLELVRQGFAVVYPKGQFPDNKHYGVLSQAEAEARQAERGIWAQ